MKRILALTIAVIMAVAAFATPPNLACEKIFERNDLKTKGYNIVKIENNDDNFRCITAENDRKLLKEVEKAVEKDKAKAFNVVERYDPTNRRDCTILNINNNGYVISIGFFRDNNGFVNLFVQGVPEAFK
ncbi:MAG: hypothetical protein K2H61_03830 [Muribaculaceae bacterium]|nr:hypothetical protein [Muribaculaceae bacterium]